MHFVRPELLLLLWLPPLWAAAALALRRRRARRLAALGPKAAASASAGGRFAAQLALCTAGLLLAVVALARPWWGEREETVETASRSVLVLLDVSRSMLATDVRPSRLGRAKADLADLAAGLRGDRAALVAFRAGTATLCPFTADTGFFLEAVAGASVDSAPRGETDLGGALAEGRRMLQGFAAGHRAIVLVSDGEDLTGRAVEEAKACGADGIPVFCVGVGGTRGADVPADDAGTPLEHRGEKVVTKLESETLVAVAAASGGVYLPLASTSGGATLGTIYRDHVRRVVREETRASAETRRIERYGLFLAPALVCLLLAVALSRGRPRAVRRAAAALLLLLALPASADDANRGTRETRESASADDAPMFDEVSAETNAPPESVRPQPPRGVADCRALAREAQRAWRGADPATALARYREALAAPDAADDAELEKRIRFNAALAALGAGDNAAAADLFGALEGPEAAAGRGLALFRTASAAPPATTNLAELARAAKERLEAMEGSAAAFRDALRARPEDPAARTNLAAAAGRIPALRAESREAALRARFDGKAPDELLQALFTDQRAAYARAARAFADSSAGRIGALEDAAGAQRAAADAWGPVLEGLRRDLLPQITNDTERAAAERALVEASDRSEAAADAMEALDPSALGMLRQSDGVLFGLLAAAAPPPKLLDFAIDAQSNALARAVDASRIRTPVEEQGAAIGLFDRFASVIQQWLQENPVPDAAQDLAAAKDDDAPMFDEEAPAEGGSEAKPPSVAEEIQRLCDETRGTHTLLRMGPAPEGGVLPEERLPDARTALANMLRIRELLNPPQQQQQNQQQQNQQQQQQQQQQNQQQSGQQGQQDQKPDKQESQQPQDSQTQDAQTQDEKPTEPQEPEDAQEQEAQAAQLSEDENEKADEELIARILEAEKRRADERRRRQHDLPPRPGVRDW